MFYFSELDSGSANGSAVLVQGKQTINGDRIEYKELPESDGVSYSARGNVTIIEEGGLATCGEAIYDRSNGKTILKLNPKILDSGQTISGSEIFLEYDEDELQNIFIPSNAKATHPITGNRKWLEIISEDTIEYSDTASFVDDMTVSYTHLTLPTIYSV